METRPAYSFLHDLQIPSFEGGQAFTVIDAKGARWIAHNDQAEAFRILPAQSDLGRALLRHYGLDPADPAT